MDDNELFDCNMNKWRRIRRTSARKEIAKAYAFILGLKISRAAALFLGFWIVRSE